MATITFVQQDGTERTVEAKSGQSVMDAAVKNGIPGIVADCGGACACATCHVYVDAEWRGRTGARAELEDSMLEFAEDVQDCSRLSCQLKMNEALDGLRVMVPERQAAVA